MQEGCSCSAYKCTLGDKVFRNITLDEITRVPYFDWTTFLVALSAFIGPRTDFILSGGPCQTGNHASMTKLTEIALQHHQVGTSVMEWLFNLIMTSKISEEELVSKVDFCNRDQPGQRCRAAVARMVTQLSTDCLPAPGNFWTSPVEGNPICADLAPRTAITPLDTLLDSNSPEVICFHTFSLDHNDTLAARGRDATNSRYDLNLCIISAAVALAVAFKEAIMRRKFDCEQLKNCGVSLEEARTWRGKKNRSADHHTI